MPPMSSMPPVTEAPAPKTRTSKASLVLVGVLIVLFAGFFVYYKQFMNPSAGARVENTSVSDDGSGALSDQITTDRAPQFSAEINESIKGVTVTFSDGMIVNVPTYWEDFEYFAPSVGIVDVNFDGSDDLILHVPAGAYNMTTFFYAQDPVTKTFADYTGQIDPKADLSAGEGFSGLGAVSFVAEKRMIESFYKGRGLADIYVLNTYNFLDGSWKLVQTERQDWLGDDNLYYINEIARLDGARWATTTTYWKGRFDANSEFRLDEISKEEAMKHKDDKRNG